MKNFFITRILSFIGGKLDGYKTKIGGVGFILIGLCGLAGRMFPDQEGLPDMTIEASIGSISAGMAAIGLGAKADKNTAAVEAASKPYPSDDASGIGLQ